MLSLLPSESLPPLKAAKLTISCEWGDAALYQLRALTWGGNHDCSNPSCGCKPLSGQDGSASMLGHVLGAVTHGAEDVAWAMSSSPTLAASSATRASSPKPLIISALKQAIAQRHPRPGLIHHSDREVKSASSEYIGQLQSVGAQISMSSVSNPYDNAKAESFAEFFAGLNEEK